MDTKKKNIVVVAILGVQTALVLFACVFQSLFNFGYGLGLWLGLLYLATGAFAVWQMKDSRPWLSIVKVLALLLATALPFIDPVADALGLHIPADQNLGLLLFMLLGVTVCVPTLLLEPAYSWFNYKWRVAAQPVRHPIHTCPLD